MRQRVTITQRHNGKIYLGITPEQFKWLVWTVRARVGSKQNYPEPDPELADQLAIPMRTFEDRNPDVFT